VSFALMGHTWFRFTWLFTDIITIVHASISVINKDNRKKDLLSVFTYTNLVFSIFALFVRVQISIMVCFDGPYSLVLF
jgi:hypothetical protein